MNEIGKAVNQLSLYKDSGSGAISSEFYKAGGQLLAGTFTVVSLNVEKGGNPIRIKHYENMPIQTY